MNSFSHFSTIIIPQCAFIRTIDFSNPADIARHDKMGTLAGRIIDHHSLYRERRQVKRVT